MEWQVILALVLAIPILLLPVVFVWYLTIGGLYGVVKARRTRVAPAEYVRN